MCTSGGTWFPRFADVPGVGYPGDLHRRALLQNADEIPTVSAFDFDGRVTMSVSWALPDGATSQSPASRCAYGAEPEESGAAIRERILNVLELPGEPLDYHFAMQGAAEKLFRNRRTEPEFLPLVEWLAHYDARLVETHESLFRLSPDGGGYVSIFALDYLVDHAEREGYVHEALAFAERFARFSRRVERLERLRQRVALLKSETDG